MPDVRYYDYGVMRREADRRMYEAQSRTGRDASVKPAALADTESVGCQPNAEETRPAHGRQPEETQDVSEPNTACAVRREGAAVMPTEELLIIAMLMLALSEGSIPLAMILLWLLM